MRNFRFLFLLLGFFCSGAKAQTSREGDWTGKLSVSRKTLTLVLHLKATDSGYVATLDSPDQGATGIAATKVTLVNDSLEVDVFAGAKLTGRFVSDTMFDGRWHQGVSLPVQFKKQRAGEPVARPLRPQTPKPPFPYKSEDVLYFNADKSIQYGATVTSPQGSGPFPALVLITGSGAQDRDETLFGHKPFAVLADYLTRRGFVVLRVDDRGVGQTTGETQKATSKDFAGDVALALDYVKALPQVDGKKLGLLGHSEGGMIAQLVAAGRQDVSFLVLLAAPGQPVIDLMTAQNGAILEKEGWPPASVTAYLRLYKPLVSAIAFAPSDTAAQRLGLSVVDKWIEQTPTEVVRSTTQIINEEGKRELVSSFTKQIRNPWFNYFIQYNPDTYVRKVKAKVLALNGEKDIQVVAKPNLTALKASLQKGGNKNFDVIELPGLNHLFQQCIKCTVAEYAQLEETISPAVLNAIGKWLAQHVAPFRASGR